MHILKRTLPERIWRRLARHPVLVVSTASLGVKVTRDALRMRSGEIDGTEFRARTGRNVGGMSGGLAGAAAGAAWGSVLPGLGTMLGAMAGGIVGEELGGRVGRLAIEQAEITWRERRDDLGVDPNAAPPVETGAGTEEPPQPPRRHL